MKIDSVKLIQYHTPQNKIHSTKECQKSTTNSQALPAAYPAVYFTGRINNINFEKNNLLRTLNEILKEDAPDEEINQTELQYKALKVLSNLKKQLEDLYAEGELLWEDRILNPQQKYDRAVQIKKEVNSIKKIYKSGFLYVIKSNNQADEKTDYVLINKFKSSIEKDNFNLKKVFQDYYQPLNDIHSLKEVIKKYPKIKIPSRPEEVIARKLENTITRDFYEDLYDAFEADDKNKAKELLSSKVMQLLNDNIKIKSQEEKDNAYKKLIGPTLKEITIRYHKLHNKGSFTSVPEFRKQNKNLLSENDIKLLGIDYDDFVLKVLQKQYINLKNPNEIIYNKNGKTIKVSSLKEPNYKFEKIPTRIFKIIKDSENIKASQRDYKHFTKEHFKTKLEFYSGKFDESEKLLNTIVQFDSCLFGEDDVKMLIKFLQEADKVWDGDKTIKELEDYVYDNSIRPIHTEKMNTIERNKKIEAIKAENKKLAALRNIQDNFDSYINILYENNLNYLAEVCSKYKPEALDSCQIKTSKIITDIIDKNIHGNKLKNKEKVETTLMRVTNYIDYTNSAPDSQILKNAQTYAQAKDGLIDIEKAGKYILNAEFVQNYPQSLELASNKKIAQKIVENSDETKAIEYLCKYDDYKDLTSNEKTKIKNISDIFNIKDSIEKSVLKTIVEDDYINTETSSIAKLTEDGSKKAKTTIGKNAKEQIYDYYKFPKCLEYYEAFEDALGQFAPNRKSSGIKKVIGVPDANELKIMGYPDRLFAYKNTYFFDEFSPTGLH